MTDVQTERPTYEVARDAMPGYRAAEAALAAVRKHRPQHHAGSNADLVAEVVAAALAGRPVPADVGARAFATANAAQHVEAETAVMDRAIAKLKDRVDETYRDGVDAGIRALQPVFATLLGEVRALALELGGVRDAAGAVAAGPAAFTAWHGVGRLADRYQQLRGTWEALLRAKWGADVELSPEERRSAVSSGVTAPVTQVIAVGGEMSNLDEVWPDWSKAFRGADRDQLMTGAMTTNPPWPGTCRPGEITYSRGDPGFVLWLATDSAAKPWLPTSEQARAAYVAQRAAARQRQIEAEETQRYGRVRTPDERAATSFRAASDAARQVARLADAAAYEATTDQ